MRFPSQTAVVWDNFERRPDIRCYLSDETVPQSFMVIAVHCRITTISLSRSLRIFICAPSEAACFVCFIFPMKIKRECSFVLLLCWECPDSLGHLLLGELKAFVCDCIYMPKAVCVALFIFCPLLH